MINGGFKRKTLGIWSFIKKINGRSNKVTYWGSKLFIEETWPRTKHIWLHCSFSDFVQLSNNHSIHFCMPSKISEELQQDKFWRFWRRNLNGIFSVSRDWSWSFIFYPLIWLINLTGNLDCLKNSSQVKSPYHCLTIIVEKSDKILQSRQTLRNSQHHQVQTSCTSIQVQPTQVSSANKPRQLRPYN